MTATQFEYEEVWKVSDEDDVNRLIATGWKLIQVVYDGRKVYEAGWIFDKCVGIEKVPKFLMGRPKGVSPREGEYWVKDYVERVNTKEKQK